MRFLVRSLCPLFVFIGVVLTVKSQQATQQRQAFTVNEVRTYYAEGKPAATENSVRAIRSDGSVGQTVFNNNGQPVLIREVIDAQTRKVASIDPLTKSIGSRPMTDHERDGLTTLWPTCIQNFQKPWLIVSATGSKSTILGIEVEQILVDYKRAGTVTENLVAPSLGCFPLREVIKRGDQISATKDVTSVAIGEVDPAAFTIPSDFGGRTPSDFLTRYSESRHQTPPPQDSLQRLDELRSRMK